jgi:hypothetical protein
MLIYMSIATLKKKSRNNRRFAPISGRGENGFSLVGGTRNHGGIGQFRMISNTTRTPYKGTEAVGHGGNNGKYYKTKNQGGGLNSGSCCTNDNTIIKKASMNTAGMIDTKYKWTKGTYPNYWVQPDDNSYQLSGDQATYIKNLTQAFGSCVFQNVQNNGQCGTTVDSSNSDYIYSCNGNKNACSYYIGTKKYIKMSYAKNFNQPAVSYGQYISSGGVAKKKCLPTPSSSKAFPVRVNNSSSSLGNNIISTGKAGAGCQLNPLTWQEAQQWGFLPQTWYPGNPAEGTTVNYPNYDNLVQRSSNYRVNPPAVPYPEPGYPQVIPNT